MSVSSVSGTSGAYQLLQQLQQQMQTSGLMPHGHRHHGGVQAADQSQQAPGQSASAALSALTGGSDSDGDSDQSSPLNIVA